MSNQVSKEKIQLSDIENKLRDVFGSSEKQAKEVESRFFFIAIAFTVVVLFAYFLGKRKGRVKSTIVEIRRG